MSSFTQQFKEKTVDSVFYIFKSRKMLVMFILGYSSGIPIMLTASSLLLWFKDSGIDIKSIALLSLVGTPYVFKYMWSPVVDRYSLKAIGRRKSWILAMQILISLFTLTFTFLSPEKSPFLIAFIAFIISFCSATQDIAINAYQVELLEEKERAIGNSVSVLGYRVAMLVTGGGLLVLVQHSGGWNNAFIWIIPFIVLGMVGTFLAKEENNQEAPKTIQDAVIFPITEFFSRTGLKKVLIILIILILYKFGDQLSFSLNSVFFRDLGFSLDKIAIAYKTNALVASLSGLIIGSIIAAKIGIYRGFIIFSLLMSLANIMYFLLVILGKNFYFMFFSVSIEYFIGAMGTATLVAVEMSLVNKKFSATQFALFSSIDSIGRVAIAPLAAQIQTIFGWEGVFLSSLMIGLVVTVIIFITRKPIMKIANLHA